MRIHVRGSRREDGAVAIMVAFLAVILVVLVAFTTDFGMAYAQRQALATGADSAALAVVRAQYKIEMADPTHPDCDTLVARDTALALGNAAKAQTIALAQVNANAPFGATILNDDVITVLSCNSVAKVLQVSVTVNRSITPIFGGVVNASPQHIDRTALAALGVANGFSGLLPIGLCTNQAQAIISQHAADALTSSPDRAQLTRETKVWGSGAQCDGGGGSGNWGWLGFPGMGNGSGDLGTMIENGYSGPLILDETKNPPSYKVGSVPGNRGNNSHTKAAMQAIMDTPQSFPVYSTVTGSGNNTEYTIIGVLSVKLCGYDGDIRGSCYDPTVPMGSNDMQIRYVDYTPVGNFGKLCDIGSSCAFNGYVTKLVAPPSP